ncbi:MAG: DNA lyase [Magnetococcales bacterium]|nr:DNA lyase [Magnetococcales bacterium]
MRLWTIHPKYLDAKGLVALWREALLAQKVLRGLTRGYANHPQLHRFKEQPNPVGAIAQYLRAVHQEALRRQYRFGVSRIAPDHWLGTIQATDGQMLYEWCHFLGKVEKRNPNHHAMIKPILTPDPHPLFSLIEGGVASWEKIPPSS